MQINTKSQYLKFLKDELFINYIKRASVKIYNSFFMEAYTAVTVLGTT